MTQINKQIFLNTLTCPTLGWHTSHNTIQSTPTLYDQFLSNQGIEIHNRAHNLFPDGILVDESNFSKAVHQTKELINDKSTSVIFEASFSIDSFNTRADILQRTSTGWHLYEVKTSLNPNDKYIDDMAYTAMVLRRAGVSIDKCTLILISPDYRLGMGDDKLFVQYDMTEDVLYRVSRYAKKWDKIKSIHQQDTPPDPEYI